MEDPDMFDEEEVGDVLEDDEEMDDSYDESDEDISDLLVYSEPDDFEYPNEPTSTDNPGPAP